MAEDETWPDDRMSLDEYERLVLLAAKRRRGEPCEELEEWLRAAPEFAEEVELMDNVAAELRRQLDATAPSAEHREAQKARLFAEIARRRRNRRIRWGAGLAVAASLAIAVPLLWPPAVVGHATMTSTHQTGPEQRYAVRVGQTVTTNAGTEAHIDLGEEQEIKLQPGASVSVYRHRIVALDGKVNGNSGAALMQIDVLDRSIRLDPGTSFRISRADQRCTLWTDQEAKLVHGAKEQILVGGETTTLELSEPDGP